MDPLTRRGRWWESIPLAPVALSFAAGIVVERYCPTLLLTVVLMIVACGVMWLLTRSWRPTAAGLLSIIAGWNVAAWNRPIFNPQYADCEVLIEGTVTRVMEGETTTRLLIAIPDGNCQLTVNGSTTEIRPGDIITTRGYLEEPDTSIEVDGEQDYSSFYYINRIAATGYTCWNDVRVTGRSESLKWRLTAFRERLVDVIMRSNLDAGTQEFVSSVLLGCDDMITQERYDTYSSTGIAHILALSGLHVAIIAWILTVVLLPVRVLTGKGWQTVMIVLLLTCYAAMTGFQPSVTRAVVMASTFIITKLLERKRSSLNAWCLAALIILAFSPRDLFAPGFQLSFMALAAMITVPQLLPLVTTRKQWLRTIISYCYFTIAALAGTGILAIYYFGRFSYIMVIANIPVTLLFPIILVGGIVVIACNLTGIPDGIPAEITNVCCNTLDSIARWLAVHFGAADGLYLTLTSVIIGYLAITLLGIYAVKRRRVWLEVSGLVWIIFFLSFRPAGCRAHDHSFISKSRQSTTLVHTADGIAHLYTTALLADRQAAAEYFSHRYKDYLYFQGVREVIVETDDTTTIAGKRYAIPELIDSDTTHVDYLIIGRKFRGNIGNAILIYSPDSVLLGSDLDKRKIEKYTDVLEHAGTSYKVLKR